jgi:hypothetical protein
MEVAVVRRITFELGTCRLGASNVLAPRSSAPVEGQLAATPLDRHRGDGHPPTPMPIKSPSR